MSFAVSGGVKRLPGFGLRRDVRNPDTGRCSRATGQNDGRKTAGYGPWVLERGGRVAFYPPRLSDRLLAQIPDVVRDDVPRCRLIADVQVEGQGHAKTLMRRDPATGRPPGH